MTGRDMEGGALFQNNKRRTENHPHFRGELRVSRAVVESLVNQINQGVQFPKLEIAGWQKVSNSGDQFMSLKGSPLYNPQGQGGGQQRTAQQGNWPAPQPTQQPGFAPPAFNAPAFAAPPGLQPQTAPDGMDDEIPFDFHGQT